MLGPPRFSSSLFCADVVEDKFKRSVTGYLIYNSIAIDDHRFNKFEAGFFKTFASFNEFQRCQISKRAIKLDLHNPQKKENSHELITTTSSSSSSFSASLLGIIESYAGYVSMNFNVDLLGHTL